VVERPFEDAWLRDSGSADRSEPGRVAEAGPRIALPYLNFFIGNGCVIVPLACLPSDSEGLARLREVFPDREVVGVPATNLARRGGGAHCITQQPLACPAVERAGGG
jgi:agmatine deiminase